MACERQETAVSSPHSRRKAGGHARSYKRPLEANIDSAVGQPYLVYEGSILDTVLMNRLDGDAVGPVKVLVSNPLYSHDHQHVIIPEERLFWARRRRLERQASANSGGWPWFFTVCLCRMVLRRSRSISRSRSDRRGRAERQGQHHYLQIFGTRSLGCDCRSEPDHSGWRHHYHERFPGIHQRGCGQCFTVCHHDP